MEIAEMDARGWMSGLSMQMLAACGLGVKLRQDGADHMVDAEDREIWVQAALKRGR